MFGGFQVSYVAAAVVGSAVVGSVASSRAAGKAADAQSKASAAGIAEQQRQFDALQELFKPYVQAGNSSLTAQLDLLGLNGKAAADQAISNIENGPQFQAMMQQGENSILQNAAATGGLRGGNTQGALAQFRPQLLSQLINDQFTKLGGVTSIGQNSAAGQGNAGMQSAQNVSGLLQQQGAAQAGAQLARGQMFGDIAGGVGTFAALGGFSGGYKGIK